MNRRDFIMNGCAACLSITVLSPLLTSCKTTRYISGTMGNDGLTISKDEFKQIKKGNAAYRSFLIVRNDALQYPIYVRRFSDTEYTALWMRCSHQGAELQASGEYLQCPAHGSEFNNKGAVTNGPADKNLRTFPVTVNDNELFIDLRKA
ncbi:ubiquinol-cytochrome c reductase iron-sulfur subunit [Chitinophaga sp. CF418]|uniref:QcrA and Rieske domain-containing protein n=1 Tax=Chitinophaga sp. CF418 TaxID=1855287 RepID=UPI00092223F3|nr:Rieske (2Fe-2S) protein [Chitinophaga sp. CF418]SHN20155.1 Ferredoxin subunit of nitrite reductase or a ring-hydroxylating dioxygenase [Chitinophaga sp. CF418]